jgi:hypothetical protein
MYDKITVGETVKFTAQITNLKNQLTDPVGIMFKIKNPIGVSTTYLYGTDAQILKDSVGKYSIDLILDVVGTYKIRWETVSPNVSIEENTIIAEKTIY